MQNIRNHVCLMTIYFIFNDDKKKMCKNLIIKI
jgi:hypothetical protein